MRRNDDDGKVPDEIHQRLQKSIAKTGNPNCCAIRIGRNTTLIDAIRQEAWRPLARNMRAPSGSVFCRQAQVTG
jgi:hypothetical protein